MYVTSEMDDSGLVQAARQGDREAFASIYDRYADRLHAFAITLVGPHEAPDVVQDSFLDAGARLHQLRDPSKLRPWLFSIARHNSFAVLRARQRTELMDDLERVAVPAVGGDPSAGGGDPSAGASQAELAELVAAASEGLSDRDRALLDLNMRQGLEGQELGEAMGVSAGHAYVLLNRMRGQLERTLGALLVARKGSRDCGELAGLLEDWDGRFSPLLRKRVARHVEGCLVCEETKRRVFSPAQLLSAMAVPLAGAPEALRERVLSDVRLVSHRGRPWSRDGFPPPSPEPATWIRRAALVVAAVLLVGGVGASALGLGPLGESQSQVEGPLGAAESLVLATPMPSPSPEGDEEPEETPTATPAPATPSPAPSTPTPAPPTPTPAPPVIGAVTASPTEIFEQGCTPSTSTITARLSDVSVASVSMRWSVLNSTGEMTMNRSGSSWVATLGEFPPAGRQSSTPILVTVRVNTSDGEQFQERTTVMLHPCRTPSGP